MESLDFTEAEGEEAFNRATLAQRERRIDAVANVIDRSLGEKLKLEEDRAKIDSRITSIETDIEKLKAGDDEAIRRALVDPMTGTDARFPNNTNRL